MKNEHDFAVIIPAPFGAIGIQTRGDSISGLSFLTSDWRARTAKNTLAEQAAEQIRQYLKRPDFRFELPLTQIGTAFQQRVWQAIENTPAGQTITYGGLARHLHSAPRAIGQACGANPCPLITPCHRVIRTGGTLGGFSGQSDGEHFMLGVKRWLLAHEGIRFD